jgi:hypothetical protein
MANAAVDEPLVAPGEEIAPEGVPADAATLADSHAADVVAMAPADAPAAFVESPQSVQQAMEEADSVDSPAVGAASNVEAAVVEEDPATGVATDLVEEAPSHAIAHLATARNAEAAVDAAPAPSPGLFDALPNQAAQADLEGEVTPAEAAAEAIASGDDKEKTDDDATRSA